jgi:uncharacterized protein YjbI with pentapeptide repeats
MLKRWLSIRKKSIRLMRGALIGALVLPTVMGLLYLTKPLLWSGGLGIGKGETVTKEIVEKDDKGNLVKKTTKYDDGKTLWDWLSLLGVPLYLALLGLWFQWIQQKRSVELAHEQRARDEKIAHELRERDEKVAKEQRELAAEETKEEVLQVYFDRLSVLLVDKNLLAIASKVYASETQENEGQQKIEATLEERELLDSAVDVIRARTLSILRRFENDSERKTSVIRFLIEADIVSKLKLSLSGANLSKANLRRADLREVDLSEADINGADLRDANLSEANLKWADIRGAKLENIKLNKADLTKALLQTSILLHADLQESILLGADLSGVKLGFAHMNKVDLRDAILLNANLSGTNLEEADLKGANLQEATLRGAKLNKADLRDVTLRGATLREAELTLTKLEDADLLGAIFLNNPGLSDSDKADMKRRGAIFEDSFESDVPSVAKR